jgi:hypothetical protein
MHPVLLEITVVPRQNILGTSSLLLYKVSILIRIIGVYRQIILLQISNKYVYIFLVTN